MTASPSAERVRLFDLELDPIDEAQAVALILRWAHEAGGEARYVVTPNVQHAVLVQHHAAFRSAYQNASLVLADGVPIVWASRLFGSPLPARVAGSDLLPALLEAAPKAPRLSVLLLGAAPGVADRAAEIITRSYPHVDVVDRYSPPLGFENDDAENERILERVRLKQPMILVLAFGSPKQEIWAERFRSRIAARVVLCAGATIDFIAGEKRRAPRWMRGIGLEWLYRVSTEPRRLSGRYASDALSLPRLLIREWSTRRTSSAARR